MYLLKALSTSSTQVNMHAPDVPHDLKVSKQLNSTPDISTSFYNTDDCEL